ncbi:alpha/beta hydrolase [Bacillus sp. MUM 13]|uniref:alpha/beta fold hydrolase n=1 Tax=Bacillus sp. MUM 13 TaxID=1678001 RepID=UPI0008F590DB|nr:alpha/beta hydrolase [Bacillus sp. MUM 13]OIK11374.1 alpha/beta hydrolase [Bacillus sp. MUM 13]
MGHYIQTEDNVKIFAEDIGEGKPVILIHGWPLNHEMFESLMNELPQRGYRFIGIDLRGYGKSDRPMKGYDYNTMADDIKAVIDKLDLDQAVLAGFSMGGPIAARYMTRHGGHRISRLLLLSAAAPVFTQREDYPYGMTKAKVDELIKQIQEDRPAALADFGTKFFGTQPSKEFTMWFNQLALTSSSNGTIQSAYALRDEDLRMELSDIAVPTLLMHGKKDKICPYDFALEMMEMIPDAQLIPFEESGHGIFYDEKEKFNTEFLNFLQYSLV